VMAARKKETVSWSLADLDIDASTVGSGASSTIIDRVERAPSRERGITIDAPADEAARGVASFLAERGLI